jgi:predicted nuclease with RNAse H fold
LRGASSIGIDLRGSERRPTGLARVNGALEVETALARTDADILAWVSARRPQVVAIDASLTLPEGRCCADPSCSCARFGIVRDADRLLARRGYHPYWTLLPSMVPLTLRGIALRAILEGQGLCVVETFPGAVQDILGLPRKQRGVAGLARGLRRLGYACAGAPPTTSWTPPPPPTAPCCTCVVWQRR